MLAEQCGKLIKQERARKGVKQDALAKKARVSRAVLSKLEQETAKPVQTDSLDRLFAALDVELEIVASRRDLPRRIARLEQEVRRREQRERHLRLAVELADEVASAQSKIAKARERIDLWRRNKTCSAFYINRWSRLLALPPRKLAKAMCSLGEWEDALFQNSPWSWAWT